MLRNHKKLFISLLILIPLGVISWFVLFEYSIKRLENRLEVLATDLRQKGYIFSYSKFEITGNPLSVQAIFQNPHIKDPQGLFEWQGEELNVSMRPWALYNLKCIFPGDQKVFVPQNAYFLLGVLKVEGAKAVLNMTSKGDLEDVAFTADWLSSIVSDQPQPLSLQALSLKVKNLKDPLNSQISFTTQLSVLKTFLKRAPFDQSFSLAFEARLSGFQSKNSFPLSLADWRDGGGILEVNLLRFIWPPINIEAEGTLTLDKNMYPLGSFSSHVAGSHEALNTMVELGWVKKKNASAVSFMLDLLSVPDETGSKRLTVPITLQNKAFSVGPARLFKLQPVGG